MQGAEGVAMCDDQNVLALLEVPQNAAIIEWDHSCGGHLEGFTSGRGDIIASSPEGDLFGSKAARGFFFVEALKISVVTFIQSRVAYDWNLFRLAESL
jgi:hypothetical protein